MAEQGFTLDTVQVAGWSSFAVSDEDNLDLAFPESVKTFKRMARDETQVGSVLKAVKLPIRRTSWKLDCEGVDPKVADFVSENLDLPIAGQSHQRRIRSNKHRFSWSEHLENALTSLDFGFAVFEQVYDFDEETGMLRLHKLGFRPQSTISRINAARDGGLVSIEQVGAGESVSLGADRLVVYVNEKHGGNWVGTSLLRPSYKYWLLKDRLLRVQSITVERNGMGIPIYKSSPTPDSLAYDRAKAKSYQDQELEAGEDLARGMRSGDTAGAALPNGAEMQLLGVTGHLPDADTPIRYYDEQMAKSALAHFLTLGTQTGSWALGTTFADFFTMSLQTIGQQIADISTAHIVEDLVDLNFGEDVPAPRVVFDEIGSQSAPTAQALQSLVQTGVIRADQELEDFMRERYGLPAADIETMREPVGVQQTGGADDAQEGLVQDRACPEQVG